MTIYWSLKSVPELATLSQERREEIWTSCGGRMTRISLLVGISGCICCMCLALINVVSNPDYPVLNVSLSGVLPMAWTLAFAVISTHLRIRWSLPEIQKRVASVCSRCGYDIRATPDNCPECGLMVEKKKSDLEAAIQKIPQILVMRSDTLVPRKQFRVPGRKITAL
jgi:hypothetical protein